MLGFLAMQTTSTTQGTFNTTEGLTPLPNHLAARLNAIKEEAGNEQAACQALADNGRALLLLWKVWRKAHLAGWRHASWDAQPWQHWSPCWLSGGRS